MIFEISLIETSSTVTSDVTFVRSHDFEKLQYISQQELCLPNLKGKKALIHSFNETHFEGC